MIDIKTNYPITMLLMLGREWHAEYFINRVADSRPGWYTHGAMIKRDAEQALKAALASDY